MQEASKELIIFLLLNIIVIALIATLAMYMILVHKKKQIASKNNIQKLIIDYEKEVLKTKLEIQEQTAHNIAREIHDSVGHNLTLAKLQLNTLPTQLTDPESSKIQMVVELLGHSIQQLSDISKHLNADALLQYGLLHALEEETDRIRALGSFELQYEVNGFTTYLDPQKEVVLYRIIQEGFQNIMKHAKASSTQLLLHFHPDFIQISLIDNGQGFDPQQMIRSRSTGLNNIETRIRFLNGKSNIQSEPGKGTRLQFTIPYQQDADPKN